LTPRKRIHTTLVQGSAYERLPFLVTLKILERSFGEFDLILNLRRAEWHNDGSL